MRKNLWKICLIMQPRNYPKMLFCGGYFKAMMIPLWVRYQIVCWENFVIFKTAKKLDLCIRKRKRIR